MVTRGPQLDLPDYDDAGPAPGPTLVHWALFVLGAARRRKALAAAVFLAGMSASVAYCLLKTPTYRVETRILARGQQALPSVVRPAGADEAPTRSAWELVHRRENLIALIKQANLLTESGAASPGGEPMRDRLRLRLPGAAPVDEDPLNTLALVLDKKLLVTTDDRTITISIDWSNPEQAYRLVEAALQNFLEARHLHEVTAIDEVIALLQGRAAALRDQLERVIVEETRRRAGSRGDDSTRPAAPGTLTSQSGEEIVRLKTMLDAKERAVADVEEFRRRRLADLQAQLDQTRGVYSDKHPTVVSLRQDIDALSRESPQIATLREEGHKLRQEYTARFAQEVHRRGSAARLPAASQAFPLGASASPEESERVREARFQYQQMAERVNAAQVELDAARAAFKYRYNVVWPAQVPKKPVSPNPRKVLGLGSLASLLLGLFAAAASDLREGRIVERWQVERGLDLPVLGELSRK